MATGPLAESIYDPLFGGLLAELGRPQAEERALEQQAVKLLSLFDWSAIDFEATDAWKQLAI